MPGASRRLPGACARVLAVLCVCAAALLTVTPASAETAGSASVVRSTWVWDRPDPVELTTFTAARGVTRLYVHTPPVIGAADLAWLQEVSAQAAAAGQDVWALGGDPTWVDRHGDALAWQRAALATGLFAGSHVDVEPYALDGWADDRTRRSLVDGHVSLMSKLQGDSALPLQADLPFWAHEVSARKGTWADGVLARVDGVTAMSYRDSAAGILDVGAVLLERGALAGKPVQLAAETVPLPDCTYCTFAEEGSAALDAALTDVDAAAGATSPAYAGISVHDYAHWRLLGP